MASKIIFLLALIIFPAILQAQVNKPSFSVELKLDKLNYEFGEEVSGILTIKNITEKPDSIRRQDIDDMTNFNMTLFQNGKPVTPYIIPSVIDNNTHIKIEPNRTFSEEFFLNQSLGKQLLGEFSYNNYLDTGFYTGHSCLIYLINQKSNSGTYGCIISNEICFRIYSDERRGMAPYFDFKKIMNYTREDFRNSTLMNAKTGELISYVYDNIKSAFSDEAFYLISIYQQLFNYSEDEYFKLSEYYLSNKPNGSKVYSALWCIYNNAFNKNKSKQEGIEKLNEYIKNYPDTRIETEAKKIIEYKKQQKEENQ